MRTFGVITILFVRFITTIVFLITQPILGNASEIRTLELIDTAIVDTSLVVCQRVVVTASTRATSIRR